MSYGESAAHAIVLALQDTITPARLDADRLVRRLADRGILVSFFNDVRQHTHTPWYAAVQYLGTRGFFGSYDALPGEPLREPLAEAWAKLAVAIGNRQPRDATADARDSWHAEQKGGEPVSAAEFARMLDTACGTDRFTKHLALLEIDPSAIIDRADACRLIFTVTGRSS